MIRLELESKALDYLRSDLYKYHAIENKHQLEIRKQFVEQIFNLSNLLKMNIDDYIEGKGSKTSFCYLIEFGTQSLGQIRGLFASAKFGIYYSSKKQDYVFNSNKFGHTKDEVFNNIKSEIINLVRYVKDNNITCLENNKLSPMFKGKILFMYYPNKTLPIYDMRHIDFFIKSMDLHCDAKDGYFRKIQIILEMKQQSQVFNKLTNLEFMRFLYSPYAFESEINVLKSNKDIKNDAKQLNITFIKDKQAVDRIIAKTHSTGNNSSFNEINRKKTAVGINGELFVYEYEKNNNKKYSHKIKRVGDDPSFGYDICSFDDKGYEKHIEVKTSSFGSMSKIDFYITEHERLLLDQDPRYVIYYVFGLSSSNPTIIVLNKDNLSGTTFKPIIYKVTGKVD